MERNEHVSLIEILKKRRFFILYMICIIVFFFTFLLMNKEYSSKDNIIEDIEFIGTYTTDKSSEEKEFTDDVELGTNDYDWVRIKGHFNKNIEKNVSLFFKIYYLEVHIYKNGEEIYTFGEEGTYIDKFKSAGMKQVQLLSDGIKTEDEIELYMIKKCHSGYKKEYCSLIHNMGIGSRASMTGKLVKDNALDISLGITLLTMGMLLWVMITVLYFRKIDLGEKIVCVSSILILHGLWMVTNNEVITTIYKGTGIQMLFNNILLFLHISVIIKYISFFVGPKLKKIIIFEHNISRITFIGYMILQYMGWVDPIEARFNYMGIYLIIMLISKILMLIEKRKAKTKDEWLLVISFALLSLFEFLEIINYNTDWMHRFSFLTIGTMIFLLIHFIHSIMYMEKILSSAKRMLEIDKEIMQNNISMMISQIQPHFMFNSIASIQMLCKKDPTKASVALGNLAEFLRTNMDSLTSLKPILVENEIRHVKHYLELEKIRFGDLLNIEYNIEAEGFFVPSLSIQPIVENAVKYGLGDSEDGGTVTITTSEDEENYKVIIEDDGIGFDISKLEEMKETTQRSHIGIENVKDRIKDMCNGKLEIESTVGEGTKVTLLVPKA